MVQYNKARLCVSGMAGVGSLACSAIAVYLFYITMCKNIGMGMLVIAPLMLSAAAIGLNLAILSAVYLTTELSKCDKQKGNLCIGAVIGVASLTNFGLAAYLFCSGGVGLLAPVIGSLVAAGIVFGLLSVTHLIKASNKEDKQAGSNITIHTATKGLNQEAEEVTKGNGP